MKVGETLDGRYELRESLGAGGPGEVFRARDTRHSRDVTVKVLGPGKVKPETLRRVADLLTAAAKVKHPGVAPAELHTGPVPFIVSATPRGEDLAALRARSAPMPHARALELVRACAETLSALATATGAAHRAMKPGNVWIAEDGSIRILDFAIAELGGQSTRTRADGIFVEYRAPEQIEGGPGGPASDVFTLGLLLFELLTGVHPFSGTSAFQASRKAVMQAAKPAELAPGTPVPKQIEALLVRALARKPADRFNDTDELARQLALVQLSPGAAPRRALPTPTKSEEETQSQPAVSPSEDDGTTAVSLPVMHSPVGPVVPAVTSPTAASTPIPPELPPASSPEVSSASAPIVTPVIRELPLLPLLPPGPLPPLGDRTLDLQELPSAPADRTMALLSKPAEIDRTLDLRELQSTSAERTLALPSEPTQTADDADDAATTALPVERTEVAAGAASDSRGEGTLILPESSSVSKDRTQAPKAPPRASTERTTAARSSTRAPARTWMLLNVGLALLLATLLLALVLRGGL